MQFALLIFAVICRATVVAGQQSIRSGISSLPGHYPGLCRVTYAGINTTEEGFAYVGSPELIGEQCNFGTTSVWPIKAIPPETFDKKMRIAGTSLCDETYEMGLVFTVYYWYGGSNYFHLHYDMALPLHKFIREYAATMRTELMVFMPSVETSRLQKIDWDTDAFDDHTKYWNELIKLTANGIAVKPLNRALLRKKGILCFNHIYFGTLKHTGPGYENKYYIKTFVRSVWKQLKIKPSLFLASHSHRIGLISRTNRRKILNEDELVNKLKSLAPVDLLKFEKMTVAQQVHAVQKYSVLVGVNGAGLMNGLYLPPYAVAVQLVPLNASVNWEEFGTILEGRGPYLVYHNTYEDRTEQQPGDTYNSHPDTRFHPDEIHELVAKAMHIAERPTVSKTRDEL